MRANVCLFVLAKDYDDVKEYHKTMTFLKTVTPVTGGIQRANQTPRSETYECIKHKSEHKRNELPLLQSRLPQAADGFGSVLRSPPGLRLTVHTARSTPLARKTRKSSHSEEPSGSLHIRKTPPRLSLPLKIEN